MNLMCCPWSSQGLRGAAFVPQVGINPGQGAPPPSLLRALFQFCPVGSTLLRGTGRPHLFQTTLFLPDSVLQSHDLLPVAS